MRLIIHGHEFIHSFGDSKDLQCSGTLHTLTNSCDLSHSLSVFRRYHGDREKQRVFHGIMMTTCEASDSPSVHRFRNSHRANHFQ